MKNKIKLTLCLIMLTCAGCQGFRNSKCGVITGAFLSGLSGAAPAAANQYQINQIQRSQATQNFNRMVK